MKTLRSWLPILLLVGEVQAQLCVVLEHSPHSVFGGTNQTVAVQFRNAGGELLECDLRMVLLQTSSATAARDAERTWKKLRVLPGQTVLETAVVPLPPVQGETRFLIQWVEGVTNVIGRTEVWVYPTNMLNQLRTLVGDEALGVLDPTDALKPLLRAQAVDFVNLAETGTDKFRGKLAVLGPFETKTQIRAGLREDVRALAKRGVAVVWLLPPPEKHAPLKPSFYAVTSTGGAVVVAAHDLVAQLAQRPEAQLSLLRLAEEALHPTPLDLPGAETNN